jgi:glycyl-tRNA synthetase
MSNTELPARTLGQVMKSRFFISPSFDIYGGWLYFLYINGFLKGKAGLFDLGPPLATFQQNVFLEWRRHFIEYDHMLEVDCTNVVPYVVLKNSGHVDRFTDIAIKDAVTDELFRADKYIETFVEAELKKPEITSERVTELTLLATHADSMNAEEIDNALLKYNIKSPLGNNFTKAFPFNLMFETKIGAAGGGGPAFMRPEIAQGIFMNFLRCYEYNNQKLPFASAQVGRAFRNEISPKVFAFIFSWIFLFHI